MPRKYDEEARAKAVRLVVEHAGDFASLNEALKTAASWRRLLMTDD